MFYHKDNTQSQKAVIFEDVIIYKSLKSFDEDNWMHSDDRHTDGGIVSRRPALGQTTKQTSKQEWHA